MLSTPLLLAAENFVVAIKSSKEFDGFMKAKAMFKNHPELHMTRERFNKRSTQLQPKQTTGTLTKDEINELRALLDELNAHPVTNQFVRARINMVEALQGCNRALSAELRFDFAAAAAPPSCCG